MNPRIILGSASRTRQAILKEMGYNFEVQSANIDEKAIRRSDPQELVMALAHAKASQMESWQDQAVGLLKSSDPALNQFIVISENICEANALRESTLGCADALLSRLAPSVLPGTDPILLITADQVVVHEGVIREKPESPEEARLFIEGYGRSPASTVGSVLVTNVRTQQRFGGVDSTEIYFHKIPQEVVESLIKDGSVYYAAGGLMIEHPLVSPLVESVVGTIDSVMGLPKALTRRLMEEALKQ